MPLQIRNQDGIVGRTSVKVIGARMAWAATAGQASTCAADAIALFDEGDLAVLHDLPYDGWSTCWDVHGTYPGSADPVTMRVGVFHMHGDDTPGSVALCMSGGRPILINEEEARDLGRLLDDSLDFYRIERSQFDRRRVQATQELLDAAVLDRDQWSRVLAAIRHTNTDGQDAELAEMLAECAPASWSADHHTS